MVLDSMRENRIRSIGLVVIMVISLVAIPMAGTGALAESPAPSSIETTNSTNTETGTSELNDSAESEVRAESTEAVLDITEEYEDVRTEWLNPAHFDDRADESMEEALEYDIATGTLEGLAETFFEAVSAVAGALFTVMDLLERAAHYFASVTSADVADMLRNDVDTNHDIRDALEELEDNDDAIAAASTTHEQEELYEERQDIIEQLYVDITEYAGPVHEESTTRDLLDDDGTHGYSGVRTSLELLRLLLIADYAASESWLENEQVEAHPGAAQHVRMPNHRADEYQIDAVYHSTLEHEDDYVVYEIGVPEDYQDSDSILDLRIGSPVNEDDDDTDDQPLDGIEAVLVDSEPTDPLAVASEYEVERDINRLRVQIDDPDETYYLVVRSDDQIGPFHVRSTSVPRFGILACFGG